MDWDKVATRHQAALVGAVRDRVAKGTSREVELKPLTDLGFATSKVASLLDELHELRVLNRAEMLSCPDCGGHIAEDVLANQKCPQCGHDFREEGDEPSRVVRYFVLGELSRDVPWLIAIHGFNSQGEWQRDFAWLTANKFRYHAPVLMYQYPMSRYGVMLRWRHLQLAKELGEKLRNAVRHAANHGITEPPDVVLHSFGSLLFATLLDLSGYEDLRFGRIIVAGGIVDPRYDFARHMEAGRCDAVLNHCASEDEAVGLAQIMMPTAGPCGTHGLLDKTAVNIRSTGYKHGSFFETDTLAENLSAGGPWDHFLRTPRAYLAEMPGHFTPEAGWKPLSKLVVIPVRVLCIVLPLPVLLMALNGWFQDTRKLIGSVLSRSVG